MWGQQELLKKEKMAGAMSLTATRSVSGKTSQFKIIQEIYTPSEKAP